MMALRRHTHRRPPTDLCLRGDAQRWERRPSSGCDGIDAGQAKAKVDCGGLFVVLVMINHVRCRGYGYLLLSLAIIAFACVSTRHCFVSSFDDVRLLTQHACLPVPPPCRCSSYAYNIQHHLGSSKTNTGWMFRHPPRTCDCNSGRDSASHERLSSW
jgi:hypothetical protein